MDVKVDYETGGWFYCSVLDHCVGEGAEPEGFKFHTSAAVATSCVLTEGHRRRYEQPDELPLQSSRLCLRAGFSSE